MDTPPQTPIVDAPAAYKPRRIRRDEAPNKARQRAALAKEIAAEARYQEAALARERQEAEMRAKDAALTAPSDAPVGRDEAINTLSWAIRAAQAAGDYKAIAALVKELRDYQGYAATESEDTIDALARKIAEMRPPRRPAEG